MRCHYIFNNLKTRINELTIQNSQHEIAEDDKIQQDNHQSGKTDSQKMKFVKVKNISIYNDCGSFIRIFVDFSYK